MSQVVKILSFSLFSAQEFKAQLPAIDTDRPDQTECTSTVPMGYLQVENGFTKVMEQTPSHIVYLPSMLWKVGVSQSIELRMIAEPQVILNSVESNFALTPVRLGFKTRSIKHGKFISNVSFIGHISIPHISTDNARETSYVPDFRFTMDRSISNKICLGWNLGMRWEDGNTQPIFQYTCALGYNLHRQWKCYVELYGDKPQNNAFEFATSGGLYFYPQPNIMLDLTASKGLVNTSLNYYVAFGMSFLVPIQKKYILQN